MSDFNDPLYIVWHTDISGNKISIPKPNETYTVVNGRILLDYIPDSFYKVTFNSPTGMVEIPQRNTVTNNTQYKVDYTNGVVYVHSDLEADEVIVSYYSRGVIKYPSTRIFVDDNSALSLQTKIETIESNITGNNSGVTTRIDNHVNGTAEKHGTNDILNESTETGVSLTNALNSSKTKYDAHIGGSADLHSNDDILNVSSVSGVKSSDALNTLKQQVENAVIGGSANSLIGIFSVNDTGIVNAYVGSFTGQALFTDMKVLLTPLNDSTGASTFNYASGGNVAIKKIVNGVKADTEDKDIRDGEVALLNYDGTHWVLLNPNIMGYANQILSQEFTATENQTVFTLTNGSYTVGTKTLFISVGGVVQPFSAITETNSTSFTLPSGILAGEKVFAWWYSGVSLITTNEVVSARSSGNTGSSFGNLSLRLDDIEKGDYVNVKHFGAKGDGVTDDTVAIQNAIDSNSNNIIIFPKGNYKITSTINIPSQIQIKGSTKTKSRLVADTDITMLKNIAGQSISISDITIRNTVGGARTNFDVILINNTYPTLKNIEFFYPASSTGNVGVLIDKDVNEGNIDSVFMAQILNVWIRNGRIKFKNVTDGKILNSWIWSFGTGESCIEFDACSNFLVSGNDLVPSATKGIYLTNSCSTMTICNNFFDGSYSNIYTGCGIVSDALFWGSIINGNKFWNMSEGGIDASYLSGCTISNNNFRNNNRANNFYDDIKLTFAESNTIIGNTFIQTRTNTNKGLIYNEDNTSNNNIFIANTIQGTLSNYASDIINMDNSLRTIGLNSFITSKDNIIKPSLGNSISLNQELDLYLTTGSYYISVPTGINSPDSQRGTLEVIMLNDNTKYGMQRLMAVNGNIYFRTREVDVWSSWKKIVGATI